MPDADIDDEMRHLPFRCPNTGRLVEHFFVDLPEPGDEWRYDVVKCVACASMHLINRASGKIIGE
jgi:hypothetical protein